MSDLSALALVGDIDGMRAAHARGAKDYVKALDNAALSGHIECVNLLQQWLIALSGRKYVIGVYCEWDEYNYQCSTLTAAAKGGHAACMALIHSWEPRIMPIQALNEAASGGHASCMLLMHEWGGFSEWGICDAANRGHVGCMALARSWNRYIDIVDSGLANAAMGGRMDCMRVALAWGATDYDRALRAAARGGHTNCMWLCKLAGATWYDGALRSAAAAGQAECMRLAHRWGARDFSHARTTICCSELGQTERGACLDLLDELRGASPLNAGTSRGSPPKVGDPPFG